MKEILYKGVYLQRGSFAYSLFVDKKFDALDKHLKDVDKRYKEITYGKTTVS